MVKQQRTLTPIVVTQLLIFIIIMPLLPLLISGKCDWWESWVFAFIYIFGFVFSRALAARRYPDLLAERARFTEHENTKPWDKYLAPLVGLGGGVVPLVAGLDARFGWSPGFFLPLEIAALIVILVGFAWGSYALLENRFFSGVVRIQAEKNHYVVSTGPYRWMRHPGYAGAILTYLATPIFLDSSWSLIPAFCLAIALVVRTYLEDETLKNELNGYRQYAQRTRYRLLPGVW